MYTSTVDEQGDSMTLTVPPELRERLKLYKGQQVTLDIEGDHLVVKPTRRSKYTLEELLAQCDLSIPMSEEEREWLDAPAVGRELI